MAASHGWPGRLALLAAPEAQDASSSRFAAPKGGAQPAWLCQGETAGYATLRPRPDGTAQLQFVLRGSCSIVDVAVAADRFAYALLRAGGHEDGYDVLVARVWDMGAPRLFALQFSVPEAAREVDALLQASPPALPPGDACAPPSYGGRPPHACRWRRAPQAALRGQAGRAQPAVQHRTRLQPGTALEEEDEDSILDSIRVGLLGRATASAPAPAASTSHPPAHSLKQRSPPPAAARAGLRPGPGLQSLRGQGRAAMAPGGGRPTARRLKLHATSWPAGRGLLPRVGWLLHASPVPLDV
jgi:hypothetical protein